MNSAFGLGLIFAGVLLWARLYVTKCSRPARGKSCSREKAGLKPNHKLLAEHYSVQKPSQEGQKYSQFFKGHQLSTVYFQNTHRKGILEGVMI